MGKFKKKFLYKECESCEYTVGKSIMCLSCKDSCNFSKLYNADKNCVHDVKAVNSGGVICSKCGGWFCF